MGKNSKKCDADRSKGNPKNMTLTIEGENPLELKFEIYFRHSNFDMHHSYVKEQTETFLKEGLKNTIYETM